MSNVENSRKNRVMVGELPQDFLRIEGSHMQNQVIADQQTAAALQAAHGGFSFISPQLARLTITVCQAKLTKNYGIMKMDLYCRFRVGHSVFETHTANGGGKNPRWNKVIHCHIPPGVDSLYLEIFDEKAFTTDDRVAWAHITIPEKVFSGEAVEDWWNLNGKQGDGKEGMINLVLTYTPPGQVPVPQPVVYAAGHAPIMVIPGAAPVVYPTPQVGGAPVTLQPPPQSVMPQQQQQIGPIFTEEDVKQVKDMFPNVEEEVVKSVLEANHGNKDATINSLLSMSS